MWHATRQRELLRFQVARELPNTDVEPELYLSAAIQTRRCIRVEFQVCDRSTRRLEAARAGFQLRTPGFEVAVQAFHRQVRRDMRSREDTEHGRRWEKRLRGGVHFFSHLYRCGKPPSR